MKSHVYIFLGSDKVFYDIHIRKKPGELCRFEDWLKNTNKFNQIKNLLVLKIFAFIQLVDDGGQDLLRTSRSALAKNNSNKIDRK